MLSLTVTKSLQDRPRLDTQPRPGGWSRFLRYLAERVNIVFGTQWEGCFQEADLTCTSSCTIKSGGGGVTHSVQKYLTWGHTLLSRCNPPRLVTTCLSEGCSSLVLRTNHEKVTIYLIWSTGAMSNTHLAKVCTWDLVTPRGEWNIATTWIIFNIVPVPNSEFWFTVRFY